MILTFGLGTRLQPLHGLLFASQVKSNIDRFLPWWRIANTANSSVACAYKALLSIASILHTLVFGLLVHDSKCNTYRWADVSYAEVREPVSALE